MGKEINLFEHQGIEYTINNKRAYKVVVSDLKEKKDGFDLSDIKKIIKHRIKYLLGNGDFRSSESLALLQEADIVVSNPPFSLFREYVGQLMTHKKSL